MTKIMIPPPNFIILCSKQYLWKTRLNNGMPCLNSFKVNLKNKLTEVKSTLFWAGLEREFNKWLMLYNML